MPKLCAALAAVALALAVLVPGALADPLNSKVSLVIPADCGGQPVTVVVNGNGTFTPAHVLGSTSVFVTQALDTTTEFTPIGGTTETMTEDVSKPNVHGDVVTCSFDVTQNIPDVGTFHLFGTATGFFTPAS